MKYYIVAGERSGDLHGGNLIKSLKTYDKDTIIKGFGGDEMLAAGATITVHYREMALMGFVSLITSLPRIFKFLSICKSDIIAFKPDVIILIDYGGFNLKIARFAKENNLKVYYYIPPKVWAWNQGRVWKLKKYVDHALVILPFERDFYKKFDLDVNYVGNPVLDAIKSFVPSSDFLIKKRLDAEKKTIALLPGSRKIELLRIVPLMAEVAKANPDHQFVVATVNNLSGELYQPLRNLSNVTFIENETYDLLQHAQAAIVTSGTATLETALFKVPQVVVYKTSFPEYWIARSVIKVKYLSLVNLIMDKLVVKEFIQDDANLFMLNAELDDLLNDLDYRKNIIKQYNQLYNLLDVGSASANAAKAISDGIMA